MNFLNNILKGRSGENTARRYLEKKGYRIIETNWHYSKMAEIDIIAENDGTLVFVEVKTRSSLNYGHPFEAINKNKIDKIQKAIYAYMAQCSKSYKKFRFDGIAITGLENPVIEHIENIGQY